ncbi:MAG: hypothetical protein HUU16_20615 [Candidatus Omnitrophica bacterium]|nr:hypothetical protein [Candidatus Omnitrophota bacterium]
MLWPLAPWPLPVSASKPSSNNGSARAGAAPTATPTSTGPLAASPTPTETFDISDPRLSDYNKDNVIDILDLLMFLDHWHAEMEPTQIE